MSDTVEFKIRLQTKKGLKDPAEAFLLHQELHRIISCLTVVLGSLPDMEVKLDCHIIARAFSLAYSEKLQVRSGYFGLLDMEGLFERGEVKQWEHLWLHALPDGSWMWLHSMDFGRRYLYVLKGPWQDIYRECKLDSIQVLGSDEKAQKTIQALAASIESVRDRVAK